MTKEEQRAPLLSDESQERMIAVAAGPKHCLPYRNRKEAAEQIMFKVLMEVEAKITSGELMVVKTTTLKWIHPDPKHRDEVEVYGTGDTCVSCQTRFFLYADVHTRPNFCPGCGAKIVA